ncbi:MAG: PQQ-dependent sugar dehydrogenase [Rubricoccaceae bacterium]
MSRLLGLFLAIVTACSPVASQTPGSGGIPGTDGTPLPEGVEKAPLGATMEVVASGFGIPWAVEVLGEDEFLVSERFGKLVHVRDGDMTELEGLPEAQIIPAPPLYLGGYNDVSLHPQFATNGLVYLAYVDTNYQMAVGRFDFSDRTVRDFEVVFQSNAFSIGSRIAWQDVDTFFVTQGMAGFPYPDPGAQDLANHSGKIHRLLDDGSVPPDNPVFDGAAGPTSVWSYGHRDTQGLLFENGVLFSNEHGPLGGDELNVIEPGGNYGWPLFSYGLNYDETPVGEWTEAEAAQSTVLPLKAWDRTFNMAPSGLVRLAGSAFPAWDGAFLWGALAQRRLIAYDPATDRTAILLDDAGRIRDVAQLPSGALLILRDATELEAPNGQVVKIRPM